MAARDPNKTARNEHIDRLTQRLKELLPTVLDDTELDNGLSVHGKIGGKNADFIDIKNTVIPSSDQFISLWLEGFAKKLENASTNSAYAELNNMLRGSEAFQEYLFIFLERTHLRNYDALIKNRPSAEEAEWWIGQKNASYGLLVTPRFRNGQWENDASEIRHFSPTYWTIGHILKTGFVIPSRTEIINFQSIDHYLAFFTNVLVRASGSPYELKLADLYANFVRSSAHPLEVRLLIPELRYAGLEAQHKYRLDFTVIDQSSLRKIGMELSPWSTHGYLAGVKNLTQKKINEMALDNFEREMSKHKDYFRKNGITTLIYTDTDLTDMEAVFGDIRPYLEPQQSVVQLNFHLFHNFFRCL